MIADVGGEDEWKKRGYQRLATRFRSRPSSSISMDSFGACIMLLIF